MDRDAIWKLLGDVQAQIRVFDTKAQVALGIDGVLAGFLGAQLLKVAGDGAKAPMIPVVLALGLSLVSFTSMATSFALALRAVNPTLELKQPRSHFFFAHIAEKHGLDFNSAARDLIYLSEGKVVEELGTQVAVNSVIGTYKAQRCQRALIATAVALAFYLLSLIPLSIAAYENGAANPRSPLPAAPHFQQINLCRSGFPAKRSQDDPRFEIVRNARPQNGKS